jgi:hypothetical protein
VSVGTTPAADWPGLARWQRGALVVGAVGTVVCLVGAFIAPGDFFRSWLVAFNLVLGVALGSLVVVMLQYLTGGTWGWVLRRPMEAATRTLPLVALLFVPLIFGLSSLYAWADPDRADLERVEQREDATRAEKKLAEELEHKRPYLNVGFFLARAALYFLVWNGLMLLLNSWSRRQDSARSKEIAERCASLSAPGLMLYVVTITFASIDWVMSLEPLWYSTIYGAMFGMGQVLSGFAFSVAMVLLLAPRPPLDRPEVQRTVGDLGSLLLAFLMIWAYLSFCQFLLIWSGNLPEEVPWYVSRLAGLWKFVGLALLLFQFALPFVVLLSGNLRHNRKALAGVALLVVGMRAVELLWLVVPAFRHGEVSWLGPVLYVAALAGVGGLWLSVYLWQVRQWPLLPEYNPEEAAEHGQPAHH